MVYPAQHVYLTFLGDAFTQNEEWQVGLRFAKDTLPTVVQLEEAAGAFSVWMDAIYSAKAHRFLSVKAALIGLDGKYAADTDAVEYFLPSPKQNTYSNWPAQVCVVVSTTTDRTRGYASSGRFYMPSSSMVVAEDGSIPAATQLAWATAAADLVQELNAAMGAPATVFSKFAQGASRTITGVRVGRIPDTQRRRRASLAEEYVAVPLA